VLERIRFSLRALRHRDLRLFFAGQLVSLIGTWMQQVAVSWLMYRLTGSPFMLGVIAFSQQFPTFVVAPFAGALADRWDRHRMVVVAQFLLMLQAATLAALVLTNTVQVWHVIALSVTLGLLSGIDIPARQSLLIQLVRGSEDLANAIALNSSMFNAARLIGPAIAGVLISLTGEGTVILLNAISYVPVLVALLAIEAAREAARSGSGKSVLGSVGEGFAYALGHVPIRQILTMLALISLAGIPYSVLMPVIARDVLGGDARTLGLLTSAVGFGALVGTIYLASRGSIRGLGRVIVAATVLLGGGLAALSLSRHVLFAALLMPLVGSGVVIAIASINTVLQTIVDDDMRGRVMSLYTMAFMGMSPLGGLVAGALAHRVGAPATLAIQGGVCLVVAAWFSTRVRPLRELMVPIYESRGISP
jgi:MFS family permease